MIRGQKGEIEPGVFGVDGSILEQESGRGRTLSMVEVSTTPFFVL